MARPPSPEAGARGCSGAVLRSWHTCPVTGGALAPPGAWRFPAGARVRGCKTGAGARGVGGCGRAPLPGVGRPEAAWSLRAVGRVRLGPAMGRRRAARPRPAGAGTGWGAEAVVFPDGSGIRRRAGGRAAPGHADPWRGDAGRRLRRRVVARRISASSSAAAWSGRSAGYRRGGLRQTRRPHGHGGAEQAPDRQETALMTELFSMLPGACRTPSGKFPFLKVGKMAEAEKWKGPERRYLSGP